MVVIRFARTGKKKQAFYRVVVADSKRPVTAKFIKILGWYNPHTKELVIKKEELTDWISKGARPSNSLAVLLKKEGIKLPDWVQIKEKVKKPKHEEKKEEKQEKAEPAAKAEAEAPEAEATTETPAEVEAEAEPVETKEELKEAETPTTEIEENGNNSEDGEPSDEVK